MKLAQNTRNAESSPGGESVGSSVGRRKEVFGIFRNSRDFIKKTQSWINWQKGMKMSPKPHIYGHFEDIACGLAEKEGFEPSRQLSHPTPLAGEPLRPLGYFSTAYKIFFWRRERDSNPRCLSTSLVFKTSAFNHSAISPCTTSVHYYTRFRTRCQALQRNANAFLKTDFL